MIGWLALAATAACVVGLVIYSTRMDADRDRKRSDSGGDGGTAYVDSGSSDCDSGSDGGGDCGGGD